MAREEEPSRYGEDGIELQQPYRGQLVISSK